jgi:hypothetical protein
LFSSFAVFAATEGVLDAESFPLGRFSNADDESLSLSDAIHHDEHGVEPEE